MKIWIYSMLLRIILGLLLFIAFIADLFGINNNLEYASHVDDTNPFVCRCNFEEAIGF